MDHGVKDLPEGVVGRDGLEARPGSHDVGDQEAAHLLALPDYLRLPGRAEEDEDGDEGEQEVAAEQPEKEEGGGEELPDRRRDVRRLTWPYRAASRPAGRARRPSGRRGSG